jgi:hypothetical protein
MKLEDDTYEHILAYMNVEMAQQTQSRRVVHIQLPKSAFFKLAKFIQFCIRDKEDERYRQYKLTEEVFNYEVRMNGFLVKVERIKNITEHQHNDI